MGHRPGSTTIRVRFPSAMRTGSRFATRVRGCLRVLTSAQHQTVHRQADVAVVAYNQRPVRSGRWRGEIRARTGSGKRMSPSRPELPDINSVALPRTTARRHQGWKQVRATTVVTYRPASRPSPATTGLSGPFRPVIAVFKAQPAAVIPRFSTPPTAGAVSRRSGRRATADEVTMWISIPSSAGTRPFPYSRGGAATASRSVGT